MHAIAKQNRLLGQLAHLGAHLHDAPIWSRSANADTAPCHCAAAAAVLEALPLAVSPRHAGSSLSSTDSDGPVSDRQSGNCSRLGPKWRIPPRIRRGPHWRGYLVAGQREYRDSLYQVLRLLFQALRRRRALLYERSVLLSRLIHLNDRVANLTDASGLLGTGRADLAYDVGDATDRRYNLVHRQAGFVD